ncbi:MAG TPA: 4-hydroxy-tetrahydrodipicolinate synthase, partial [Clostridium sp.]|nr:4-hydroxy-tetrahydrodipicolinate synthase [Clostridium sp.]
IAGTGSNCTEAAVNMSKWAESIGVDGVLVITPYYNKTTQKGLVEHFKAVASDVKVPMIIYNVPGRTGLNLKPETLEELCQVENIQAVKEASGDISQIAKVKALCGDKIDLYSGNDDQTIPILSLGGIGVISVLANIIPEDMHKMCKLFLEGNVKEAAAMQLKALPLMNAMFIETNPIPIKTAMNILGMNVGGLRLPLCSMSEKNLDVVKRELGNYGLLK